MFHLCSKYALVSVLISFVASQTVAPFPAHQCSSSVYTGDTACNNNLNTCCAATGQCCAGGCCPENAYCVFVGTANEACCSLSDSTQCGEAPPVSNFEKLEFPLLDNLRIVANVPYLYSSNQAKHAPTRRHQASPVQASTIAGTVHRAAHVTIVYTGAAIVLQAALMGETRIRPVQLLPAPLTLLPPAPPLLLKHRVR